MNETIFQVWPIPTLHLFYPCRRQLLCLGLYKPYICFGSSLVDSGSYICNISPRPTDVWRKQKRLMLTFDDKTIILVTGSGQIGSTHGEAVLYTLCNPLHDASIS